MNYHFHLLNTDIEPPRLFNCPFCYTPHRLCCEAKKMVEQHVENSKALQDEPSGGKMFGVLVCQDVQKRLGFLSAYSGLLAQRNDWDYFVPPVFDAQQPMGYFKTRERQISSINQEIDRRLADTARQKLKDSLSTLEKDNANAIEEFKKQMSEAKKERDRRRNGSLTEAEQAGIIAESQFQKAELRRMKRRAAEGESVLREALKRFDDETERLRQRRSQMSDGLQEWLFRRYEMLNARGERRNLIDIFKSYNNQFPPAGAGDCCAPKLLQYAFEHGLRPLCMAEFWLGKASKDHLRLPNHFYPACDAKCKPILKHMLQGLEVEENPLEVAPSADITILYEDDTMVVVDKPEGMLSVPGKANKVSAQSILQSKMGENASLYAVHRLDMDTSGLLVFAKTLESQRLLRRQFETRQVSKTYIALLEKVPNVEHKGIISLPIRADFMSRPRQVVDKEKGKTAITEYEIVGEKDGRCLVRLHPLTGRTHQLRVHCAHADGLGVPILGDRLYGTADSRLHLHAQEIVFAHPKTAQEIALKSHLDEPWMTL